MYGGQELTTLLRTELSEQKPIKFWESSRGRSQGVPKIFRAAIYRAHCAVIFVIAQLFVFRVYLLVAFSSSFSFLVVRAYFIR